MINGSLAGDLVVKSGAVLKGAGTYAGAVTVEEGGTLAPELAGALFVRRRQAAIA